MENLISYYDRKIIANGVCQNEIIENVNKFIDSLTENIDNTSRLCITFEEKEYEYAKTIYQIYIIYNYEKFSIACNISKANKNNSMCWINLSLLGDLKNINIIKNGYLDLQSGFWIESKIINYCTGFINWSFMNNLPLDIFNKSFRDNICESYFDYQYFSLKHNVFTIKKLMSRNKYFIQSHRIYENNIIAVYSVLSLLIINNNENKRIKTNELNSSQENIMSINIHDWMYNSQHNIINNICEIMKHARLNPEFDNFMKLINDINNSVQTIYEDLIGGRRKIYDSIYKCSLMNIKNFYYERFNEFKNVIEYLQMKILDCLRNKDVEDDENEDEEFYDFIGNKNINLFSLNGQKKIWINNYLMYDINVFESDPRIYLINEIIELIVDLKLPLKILNSIIKAYCFDNDIDGLFNELDLLKMN